MTYIYNGSKKVKNWKIAGTHVYGISENLLKKPMKLKFGGKNENPKCSLTIKYRATKIWIIIDHKGPNLKTSCYIRDKQDYIACSNTLKT